MSQPHEEQKQVAGELKTNSEAIQWNEEQTHSSDCGTNSSNRQSSIHATTAKRRERWEAKQARLEEQRKKDGIRHGWLRENGHYCTIVSLEDVERVKAQDNDGGGGWSSTSSASSGDALQHLESLLRPYVDLKDGPTSKKKQRRNSSSSKKEEVLFIAEGTETVRLLIQQCFDRRRRDDDDVITVKSIFVKPTTLFDPPVQLVTDITKRSFTMESIHHHPRPIGDKVKESAHESTNGGTEERRARPPFYVLVGTEEVMSAVAGFPIARGAMACGIVPHRDETWLHSFLSSKKLADPVVNNNIAGVRLLALDGICDTANMGSMIRTAAAFGIDAFICGNDCCDAWYRRSVRVSMGYIFQVPIVRVRNLACTLRSLASGYHDAFCCTSYAAVIDRDADCVLEEMSRGQVPRSWCCVVGNEANGISQPVVQACTHRLRIAMAEGVDSLSVPIATGILLHGLREREAS